MTPRLEGRVAIVTGAASWGFGRATAVRFAQEGARVMVADIDEPGARETVGSPSRAASVATTNSPAFATRFGSSKVTADEPFCEL